MSYYDDSSLFVAPNGYKASVLFAQKPMDANGQLAFTRSNDTATRVASNGLIEKVRTNLALYSEDQTNAAWTKTNVSVTGDTTANPVNGATTADTFTITTQTTVQGLSQSFTADGSIYTISVFLKKEATSKTISLKIRDSIGSGTTYATADLNLNTGVVSAVSGVASVVDYDANWWRFIVTTSTAPAAGTRSIVLRVANVAVSETFTVFGAMLEKGDIATPYIATTSAAVSVGPLANIPRIDYLGGGCGKLLLEPQTTALNQFSESFNNAYWIKNDVTISANTTETLDPAGYYGADKVVETATAARHRVAAGSTTISAANHTASVFMKKGTARYGFVTFSGAAVSTIVVDLENGTITSTSTSGTIVAQKVENYGSGWYRISVTALGTATTTTYTLQFGSAGSATPSYTANIPSFTGSTSNYLYAWGANLTATSYLQSYVPTLEASVTRGADDADTTFASAFATDGGATWFLEFDGNTIPQVNQTGANFALNFASGDYLGYNHNATPEHRFRVQASGVGYFASASGLNANSPAKLAVSVTASSYTAYANGVQINTASIVGNWASATNLITTINDSFGSLGVKQIIFFPTALSNAQLAELTA